jgi:hypothetical protein
MRDAGLQATVCSDFHQRLSLRPEMRPPGDDLVLTDDALLDHALPRYVERLCVLAAIQISMPVST